MKRVLEVLAVVVVLFLPASKASAHVLVLDETQTTGAVLHIIPDDDPIAGEPSDLYFDMQDRLTKSDATVELFIANTDGQRERVETKQDGSLVTATYTFPNQGVYELTYIVTTADKPYVFQQTQRVSRGVAASAVAESSHTWAQGLFIASMFGLAVTAIIAFNRRADIAKQSTF